MSEALKELADLIREACPVEGRNETVIPGVDCVKISTSAQRTRGVLQRSLVIVAEGEKEWALEGAKFRYRPGDCVVSLLELPVMGCVVSATRAKPYLGMRVSFDPLQLSEVAGNVRNDPAASRVRTPGSIFTGRASEEMLDAAVRLARLFAAPDDVPALSPSLVRELLYYFLKGPNGQAVLQFTRTGSKAYHVARALHRLKSALDQEIDVDSLAKEAGMSRASFFKAFKEVTAMSPIQYQKRLRLLEARQRLTSRLDTAESAAYRVGYKSASQFSREYLRLFGDSPIRDASRLALQGVTPSDP